MELIFLSGRIFYWLFIAPIWWLAINLAGMFYPYEGDNGHFVLSIIFSIIIAGMIIGTLWFLFW